MLGHLHLNTQDMNWESCSLLKQESESFVSTQGPEAGDASQNQQVKTTMNPLFFSFFSFPFF